MGTAECGHHAEQVNLEVITGEFHGQEGQARLDGFSADIPATSG